MLSAREIKRKAHLEALITALEAAQLGAASSGNLMMSINGRSIQRMNPMEVEKQLTRAYAELDRLEKKDAGTLTRTVRVIG